MFLRKKRSDKNKTVKFLLQPRTQKDPLVADYEAPQNVLVPKDGADIEQITKRLSDFDPKLFPSKEETKVGMLERAFRPDKIVDPDILQALSKDFDFEDPNNILDDDFMDQAGGLIEDDDNEEGPLQMELLDDTDDLFGEDDCEVVNFNISRNNNVVSKPNTEGDHDEDEDDDNRSETKSVFTNYSMTSSVMRRSQGLQQIDEHFERLYEKEYADDTEIGALDLNEVKGDEVLKDINQIRQMKQEVKVVRKRNHGDDYEPEVVSNHHKNAIIGSDDEEEDLVETEVVSRVNRVDCESVLSYNSNLYNHPKLIVEPRKRPSSQSNSQMEADDESVRSRSERARSVASSRASVLSRLSVRPDQESPEERRVRKKALKRYRQERRQERKQNQQIFKKEQTQLVQQQRGNQPALRLA